MFNGWGPLIMIWADIGYKGKSEIVCHKIKTYLISYSEINTNKISYKNYIIKQNNTQMHAVFELDLNRGLKQIVFLS